MRIVITSILICFLFFSCEKKEGKEVKLLSENQKRIGRWYNQVDYLSKETPDSIASFASKMEIASANEPNEYKAMSAFVRGISSAHNSAYLLSNQHYEKGLRLLQKSNADTLKAKIYNAIGNNYKVTGNYSRAVEYLYKALKIYEKKNDKVGICRVNSIIGEVYFQKDDINNAKNYLKTALQALEHDKSNSAYLSATHLLANIYGMLGNYESALAIDEEGIRITDSIKNTKMKVAFLDNKANCYLFSNRLDSAQYYFEKCLELDIINGNKKQIADTYSNMGLLYSMKKEYNKAEDLTLKSIAVLKEIDGKPNLGKAYNILIEIYSKQGLFKKVSEVQNEKFTNYASMISDKHAMAEAEFKTVYETQKKESKIQLLQKDKKINTLKINEQQNQIERRNFLIGVFILLIISALVVWYFWNSKRKLTNKVKEEQIIQKTEEVERIRIAKDIHDDLGSGLSKINFLSELILQKTEHLPEINSNSKAVKETASKMIENMRDLIWALNPENTTLANLIARVREYTTDYLEDMPIAIHYEIAENVPQIAITKESHRELFMVVKEAINNIAKHSNANTIHFKVSLDNDELGIDIQDDGIGFENASKGNGIVNMQSRIVSIGGVFTLQSKKNIGTQISWSIPLKRIIKNKIVS
ncbi:tetratricopeptide repeat-containing sensor histidine kinase [Flavobacterium sp.]|uniref:tetratricopeptide repeat-containing sensor histidine kinase n=1 Tax=Flavobacterium sp. TaxID=239 RepID=UPI002B4AF53E|nr:tetratricopeptide repeat protein [Flavobacterium sp.]HLP64398.1 tetratricopeptide repeat protein [Flavobacterium sp.]